MQDKKSEPKSTTERSLSDAERSSAPIYQKPVLRKYDQIGQVKPYGPTELEAG
jgi:hypothetical protein